MRTGTLLLLLAVAGTVACDGSGAPDHPVASALVANSPTSLSGSAGTPVTVPPSVIVQDEHGAALSGVAVTFAVTAGNGTIAGGDTVSNDSGVAALSQWIMGAVPGANTVIASSPGAPSITFLAQGLGGVCDTIPLLFATAVAGALAPGDCSYADSSYVDYYTVQFPTASAYYVREASAAFDTYLVLYDSAGRPLAYNDDSLFNITTNSAATLLVPPGRYLVGANSYSAYETGAYTLRASATSAQEEHCSRFFTVPGLVTDQSVLTTDCLEVADSLYGDLYWVYLDAGETVTVTEKSASFDALLGVYEGLTFTLLATNDDASDSTTDAQLTFTAPISWYYAVFATTALPLKTGEYNLSIQPVAAGAPPTVAARQSFPALLKATRQRAWTGPTHLGRLGEVPRPR